MYFKPESILLEDPEKQRIFRENLIKKASNLPKLKEPTLMAEDFNREMANVIDDLSYPTQVRAHLANYFQRRFYQLQHKKYKVLLRWAHFALVFKFFNPLQTSEYMDRMGNNGSFTFGRIQYEVENTLQRYERLSQEDDYEIGSEKDHDKMKTKPKGVEGAGESLYTQKPIKRAKWLPIAQRYEIFKEAHIQLNEDKLKVFQETQDIQERLRQQFNGSNLKKTDDLRYQLEEIIKLHYPQVTQKFTYLDYKQKAPTRLTNLIELQLIVIDRASEFNIYGDIELDEGHSFTYQVGVFHTTYFQRQIIKSQFSVYDQTVRDMKDAFEANEIDDESGDFNEIQRRNLKSLLLIDYRMVDVFNTNQNSLNIYLLKKGKSIQEQIPDLKENFENIKVIRLKKAYWLEFIMMKAQIPIFQKQQQGLLNYKYSPDLLLKSCLDLIDLNDLSSVNQIYSEMSHFYSLITKDIDIIVDDMNKLIEQTLVRDLEAKRILEYFKDAFIKNNQENEHKTREVKGGFMKQMEISRNSPLRNLPKHYLTSLFLLRHMKMKDTKTKLLYVLNFFRSVQKRLTLELREFSGKEVNPQNIILIPPQEATYMEGNSSVKSKINNTQSKANEGTTNKLNQNMTKDDKDYLQNTLVDIKQWKFNKHFQNQFVLTSPILPSLHCQHGEVIEDKYCSAEQEFDKSSAKSRITQKAVTYLSRIDQYIIDEKTQEIYVQDDFGINVMYDCALEDMVGLDKELVKIGTYYTKKNEDSFDFRQFEYPFVDRLQVVEDLLVWEFEFQFEKAKLVMLFLEAFEHTTDPLEQYKSMQVIIDLIALRPRLDVQDGFYFKQSYQAEVKYLKTYQKVIKEIIDYQIENERKENTDIKQYLQMTYKLANEYINKKWTDTDQSDLTKDIQKRQVIQGGMRLDDLKQLDKKQVKEVIVEEKSKVPSPEKPTQNTDKFVEALGFKQLSIQEIMNSQSNTDDTTEEVMNQDSNFVKTQEGYPMFFRSLGDGLSKTQFSNLSNQIGMMDFYDSLSSIHKVHTLVQANSEEIIKFLKPINFYQDTVFCTIMLEKIYVQFKRAQAYVNEDLEEYEGSQYIENDLLMGSADKVVFLIKDCVAYLTKTYKKHLNPFIVAKLDLQSVNFFDFPDLTKQDFLQLAIKKLDVYMNKNFIETQLSNRVINQERFFPKLREDEFKVNVPPMLILFCNLVELIRLREVLIKGLSECAILSEVYNYQKEIVNRPSYTEFFNQKLGLESLIHRENINYIEEGIMFDNNIGLAINEYDDNLRSNINFMNSQSLQCMLLEGGIAEFRAVSSYQTLHKQALIVQVVNNTQLLDASLRALSEIELFSDHRIKVPNSIINYQRFYRLSGNINEEEITYQKSKYKSQQQHELSLKFQAVQSLKIPSLRLIIEKKFKQQQQALLQIKIDDGEKQKPLERYTIEKIMRNYKIQLLQCYCAQAAKFIQLDCMKAQAIDNSRRLKQIVAYYPKEIEFLKLHRTEPRDQYILNTEFSQLHPEVEDMFKDLEIGEFYNLFCIPSHATLINIAPLTFDQNAEFESKAFDFEELQISNQKLQEQKFQNFKLRQKLSKLSHKISKKHQNDLSQVKQSRIFQIYQVYNYIKLIFEFHFFISKLQSNPQDSILIEFASRRALKYWNAESEVEDLLITEVEDNTLSDKIMKKMVQEKKQKSQQSEELEMLSNNIKNIFARILEGKVHSLQNVTEGLGMYFDQLQYQMAGSYLFTLEGFYEKNKKREIIETVHSAFTEFSNINLIFPHFENGTIIHPFLVRSYQQALDTNSCFESEIFEMVVKGLKFEAEMCPPHILLLDSLFQPFQSSIHSTNFTGQLQENRLQYQFENLLDLEEEERQYFATSFTNIDQQIANSLKLKYNITNGYSEIHLQKKEPFIQDFLQSKLMLYIMIILTNGQSLTLDPHKFNYQQLSKYKQDFGWKIEMEHSKKLAKALQKMKEDNDKVNIKPSQSHIDREVSGIISTSMQNTIKQTQDKTFIQILQEQQTIGAILKAKAMIKISKRELEKIMIKSSIDVMSKHISAISKSIEMCSKNIDSNIDPSQCFAATLFDQVNQNSHLELVNRMSSMQSFLTKLRNRGMEIETLTSGPGIVFTVKDFNECLNNFCFDIISYQEQQNKLRIVDHQNILHHLQHLLYIKDTRIWALRNKFKQIHDNITRIVNARIYEKGQNLIFELDKTSRELRFYSDHLNKFERELKDHIRQEFRQLLQRKDIALDHKTKQIKDTYNVILEEMKEHVVTEQRRIKKVIKLKSRQMRDIDNFVVKRPPESKRSQMKEKDSERTNKVMVDDSEVQHREWIISPEEATHDLNEIRKLLIKQRTFWQLKFESQKKKYEDEVQLLKEKLVNNKSLWDQLQEQDRKNKVTQQELLLTQKSLSQCERIIERMKEELKESENERIRLFQYKSKKQARLQELEKQAKKMDMSEHMNVEKVAELLQRKESQLNTFKNLERNMNDNISINKERQEKETEKWKILYEKELQTKKETVDKINDLREILKTYEQSEGGLVQQWQLKYHSSQKLINQLQDENKKLVTQLKQLQSSRGGQRSRNSQMSQINSYQPADSYNQSQNLFLQSANVLPQIKSNMNSTHDSLNKITQMINQNANIYSQRIESLEGTNQLNEELSLVGNLTQIQPIEKLEKQQVLKKYNNSVSKAKGKFDQNRSFIEQPSSTSVSGLSNYMRAGVQGKTLLKRDHSNPGQVKESPYVPSQKHSMYSEEYLTSNFGIGGQKIGKK